MPQAMTLDLSADGAGVENRGGKKDTTGFPTPTEMGVVSNDPATVNAITARVMAEDVVEPVISGPPDGSVTLLAGYIDKDGNRFTSVEIRELRGRDEESLARALATGDMSRFTDAVVRSGVTRIGDIEDEAGLKAALDTLLIGDRSYLCLEIRRMAYGDTIDLTLGCPYCSHSFEGEYSFSGDVPIKQFAIEGFDDLSERAYKVTCPSGASVTIRPMDGAAQKRIYTPENIRTKNDEERNTLLLADLIIDIDGKPVNGVTMINSQKSRDRRFLIKWIISSQPGPQYDKAEVECPECTRSFPVGALDLVQMFRGA